MKTIRYINCNSPTSLIRTSDPVDKVKNSPTRSPGQTIGCLKGVDNFAGRRCGRWGAAELLSSCCGVWKHLERTRSFGIAAFPFRSTALPYSHQLHGRQQVAGALITTVLYIRYHNTRTCHTHRTQEFKIADLLPRASIGLDDKERGCGRRFSKHPVVRYL